MIRAPSQLLGDAWRVLSTIIALPATLGLSPYLLMLAILGPLRVVADACQGRPIPEGTLSFTAIAWAGLFGLAALWTSIVLPGWILLKHPVALGLTLMGLVAGICAEVWFLSPLSRNLADYVSGRQPLFGLVVFYGPLSVGFVNVIWLGWSGRRVFFSTPIDTRGPY